MKTDFAAGSGTNLHINLLYYFPRIGKALISSRFKFSSDIGTKTCFTHNFVVAIVSETCE